MAWWPLHPVLTEPCGSHSLCPLPVCLGTSVWKEKSRVTFVLNSYISSKKNLAVTHSPWWVSFLGVTEDTSRTVCSQGGGVVHHVISQHPVWQQILHGIQWTLNTQGMRPPSPSVLPCCTTSPPLQLQGPLVLNTCSWPVGCDLSWDLGGPRTSGTRQQRTPHGVLNLMTHCMYLPSCWELCSLHLKPTKDLILITWPSTFLPIAWLQIESENTAHNSINSINISLCWYAWCAAVHGGGRVRPRLYSSKTTTTKLISIFIYHLKSQEISISQPAVWFRSWKNFKNSELCDGKPRKRTLGLRRKKSKPIDLKKCGFDPWVEESLRRRSGNIPSEYTWKIPWIEGTGGLQSMGSQQSWIQASTHTHTI